MNKEHLLLLDKRKYVQLMLLFKYIPTKYSIISIIVKKITNTEMRRKILRIWRPKC